MTPHEFLDVKPNATVSEVTAAYRVLVQIFHPDRYNDSPEAVRREAERQMKDLNEAYKLARQGPSALGPNSNGKWTTAAAKRTAQASQPRSAGGSAGVPWAQGCRERAAQAVRANEARQARERSGNSGQAKMRPKTSKSFPHTVSGMGEARFTNNMACRRCQSIQWLPPGWNERLAEVDFFCSSCDNVILSRAFGR
ncbi:MAG: J domain-containing protein [Acidimicrobiales bacterium]